MVCSLLGLFSQHERRGAGWVGRGVQARGAVAGIGPSGRLRCSPGSFACWREGCNRALWAGAGAGAQARDRAHGESSISALFC